MAGYLSRAVPVEQIVCVRVLMAKRLPIWKPILARMR